jgi:hypothetical protein
MSLKEGEADINQPFTLHAATQNDKYQAVKSR